MARLGLFGGTFDPPHIGHLILADEARMQLGLDKVLWVLTPFPPHKTGQKITPVVVRLELLQAALADNPTFEISEIDMQRPPPHYALDTVRLLRQAQPEAEWVYLMGGDSLADLPRWHEPQKFVLACDQIGVLLRPGRRPNLRLLEERLPGLTDRVRWIKAPQLQISSREIRQRLSQGQSARYYLPEAVHRLVEHYQLYR